MKILYILVITLFSLFNLVVAEDLKFGIVDFQKIMRESPQMMNISKKLNETMQPLIEELKEKEQKCREYAEEYKKNEVILTVEEKKDLEQRLSDCRQDLDESLKNYQLKAMQEQNKLTKEFEIQFRQASENTAKAKNLDILFLKETVPYVKNYVDVTEEILKSI